MISINLNTAASKSGINLSSANSELQKSLSKLSSGSRIVDSSDDAGGLAVSMKMNATELQLGALDKNLQNSLSYLETQEGALRVLGTILTRIDELEALKKDITKNKGDTENYDKEINNLNLEIKKIREEKFNGIRLFSPKSSSDYIQVDAEPLNNSIVDIQRPPLPFDPNPLELVFVVDTTGSMGGTITNLQNNIEAFIDQLPSNVKSWKAKVIGFKDLTSDASPLYSSSWTMNLADLKSSLSSLSPGGGGDTPESLIDGIANAVNSGDWSASSTAKRAIIAFTDAATKMPVASSGTLASIAADVKAKNIDLQIFGVPEDVNTSDFSTQSGATLRKFSDSSDMLTTLTEWGKKLSDTVEINLDLVADYIAQNGASQSAIRNLKDSSEITQINTQAAKSRITDVDIASESTKLTRFQILQQASTSILSQANLSHKSLLKLLNVG